ncbi:MAG: extracellular solute-binding protein [Actinomycetales bacterium]|nr:extracellular solute-binding protein [Actinomycetales bacterium]
MALALTACGGGDGGSDDATTGGSAAPGEKITLTVATFNEWGYEGLIEEYMELNPDITVEHKKAATSDEARTNLNTRLAAGSGLSDIEGIEVDWVPEMMQYADRFVDLSDPALEGRWLEWKTAAVTTEDGKLIGYGSDIGPEGVCYRSDLFAQAGLPTDRDEVAALLEGDWDNYFAVGKQFVDATGIPWFDASEAIFQGMINQLQNPFEEDDGTPIPLAENTEIKAIYDRVMTAAVDENLSANFAQWSEDWTNSFQTNGFATMLCPGWMLGVIEGNAAGVEGWDIADVFPGGGGNWGGSYLTVPTQTEHPEEAKALAAWLTAPEQQIKAFLAKGTFPSQVDALTSEDLLSITNPFFNDAPTGQILANRAEAVTVTPFKGPNYFSIRSLVTDAINRVDVDNIDDPATSWDKALQGFKDLGL